MRADLRLGIYRPRARHMSGPGSVYVERQLGTSDKPCDSQRVAGKNPVYRLVSPSPHALRRRVWEKGLPLSLWHKPTAFPFILSQDAVL